MAFTDLFLLFTAGMVSGALNAIVGGGAFIAFPALIFLGAPAISANATMTVSLWPGTLASMWAQRKELSLHIHRLPLFIVLSLIGGGVGALLVIHLSNAHFSSIVSVMLCVASVLFTWRDALLRGIQNFPLRAARGSFFYWLIIIVLHVSISIYGGFFGAGMGVMFLAFLSSIGIRNMHEANAVRNCSAACINSVASLVFIISGNVLWSHMILMCTGAMIGGYFCAHYARRLPSEWIRYVAIILAWGMTFYFVIRQWSEW